MLIVYWTDTQRPPSVSLPDLSAYRLKKLETMKDPQARMNALAAEGLLLYALKRENPGFAPPLDIDTDEFGKPFLSDRSACFNLSHSAQFAACALGEHELGLDTQTDLDALDAALEESHQKTNTARTDLKKIEAELNTKKELQRHVLNARDAKDLHAEYLKLPKKKQEKFYEENRPALMLYDAAMRYFKENGIKTIPAAKRIQDEIEDLTSAKNAGYTEYRESQKREKELQTVKANIEKMLRHQEPEIEQNHKKQEQEL